MNRLMVVRIKQESETKQNEYSRRVNTYYEDKYR